jgi:methyl-accepting chemotaxis protein
MNNNVKNDNSLSTSAIQSINGSTDPSDSSEDPSLNGGGFSKVALGVLIGATIGGIATALTNKGTVDRVNQSIKGIGNSVKGVAIGFNKTVKEVGTAFNSVVSGVNEVVQDVGSTVRTAAEEVNETVESTMTHVKDTKDDVSDTMKSTSTAIQNTVATIQYASEQIRPQGTEPAQSAAASQPSSTETLYRLVPVTLEQPTLEQTS